VSPARRGQNPYAESFGARVRDGLLDVEQFASLAEAQVVIADWRLDYNHRRPRSALGMRTPAGIVAILRECGRLLPPKGVLSCSIDLQDHYSFDDPRISVYNFVRYSPRTWRLVNSSLHHQNRLRAPDHIALLRRAGLQVIDVRAEQPAPEERLQLAGMPQRAG
jgi:Integrase core domain